MRMVGKKLEEDKSKGRRKKVERGSYLEPTNRMDTTTLLDYFLIRVTTRKVVKYLRGPNSNLLASLLLAYESVCPN